MSTVIEQDKNLEVKSMLKHPGWAHCMNYILSAQTLKFNEMSKQGVSTEDILKAVGSIEAMRRFVGWIEATASQGAE